MEVLRGPVEPMEELDSPRGGCVEQSGCWLYLDKLIANSSQIPLKAIAIKTQLNLLLGNLTLLA